MAKVVLDEETIPGTPASGAGTLYYDSTVSLPAAKNDAGTGFILAGSCNAATAAQGAGFSSDTYLTNSDLLIPSFGLQAKARFKWLISASKSGAGTAQPVYTLRIGPNRSTADTSRLALTGPLQTAIADIGTLTIMVTLRNVGAAGVLAGTAWWDHRGTAANTTTSGTGFANDTTGHVEGNSAAFDTTALGGNYVGLSINGGASASWTVTQVWAEAAW